MSVLILHHAGDGNVPPVRIPGTVDLAHHYLGARIAVLAGPEADALVDRLGEWRVLRYTGARTTVGEIIASRAFVASEEADTLILSTEQGHRRRSYLAARIIYAGTGVTIRTANYPGGTYRSPRWEVVRDVLTASWWKLTHRL